MTKETGAVWACAICGEVCPSRETLVTHLEKERDEAKRTADLAHDELSELNA
jgi:hypothetical protein